MTALEKYLELVAPLIQEARKINEQLGYLIASQQNFPPQGEADGSFDATSWLHARKVSDAVNIIVMYGKQRNA